MAEEGHVSMSNDEQVDVAPVVVEEPSSAPSSASDEVVQPVAPVPVVETAEDRLIRIVTENPSDFDSWEGLVQLLAQKVVDI